MNDQEILLHQVTRYQFDAAIQSKVQAVLILGDLGSGKQILAHKLASQLMEIKDATSNPSVLQLYPIDNKISIESIRSVKEFVKRKALGSKAIRRVIIIHEAQTMGDEAQNALLKILEEPPDDTAIILTSSDYDKLRPTIRSRVQIIRILKVGLELVEKFYKGRGYNSDVIRSTYFMSGGALALMAALLQDSTDHPLVKSIADAKKLLTMKRFERLALVDGLSKQKHECNLLLNGLGRVVNGGLHQSIASKHTDSTKRFYSLSKSIQNATEALNHNANAKLVLTNLFLDI